MRNNFDMNKLMKQAQKMQQELNKKQKEVSEINLSSSSGGGMVKVSMNGNYDITSLSITPEIVDPSDVEMLTETLLAAIKEVKGKIDKTREKELNSITGGMNIPGM